MSLKRNKSKKLSSGNHERKEHQPSESVKSVNSDKHQDGFITNQHKRTDNYFLGKMEEHQPSESVNSDSHQGGFRTTRQKKSDNYFNEGKEHQPDIHQGGFKPSKPKKKENYFLDKGMQHEPEPGRAVDYDIHQAGIQTSKMKKKEKRLTVELFGEVDNFVPRHMKRQREIESTTDYNIPNNHEEFDDGVKEEEVEKEEVNKDKRKAAWEDEDDDDMRTARNIDSFCDLYGGKPEWARLKTEDEKDDDDDDHHNLERRAAIFTRGKTFSNINIDMCKDLNRESGKDGKILHCVEFNPKFEVGLVAGCSDDKNGSASLFQVDGVNNYKIQSVKFPNFPIKCGQFLADGRKFVVSSAQHGHFYSCDMESGAKTLIASNIQKNSPTRKVFKVSPCGTVIAFVGNQRRIDLVDTKTMEFIHEFRVPGVVNALDFSKDGQVLYTHTASGKVYIFDVGRRSCIQSFIDEGCLDGTSIAVSSLGTLACGSSSGIVNIYNKSTYMNSPAPTPYKALSKLVMCTTQLRFNPTGDILATASGHKDEHMRLVHLPSAKYFDNFPKNYQLSKVNSVSFSPGSGFMAVGNNKGSAKLFKLSSYDGY